LSPTAIVRKADVDRPGARIVVNRAPPQSGSGGGCTALALAPRLLDLTRRPRAVTDSARQRLQPDVRASAAA
jgi:hypothetical protein